MFVHIREPIIWPKISGKGCQMKIRDRNAKFAEKQGWLGQSELCSKNLGIRSSKSDRAPKEKNHTCLKK
jgi:hypothetical protein